MIVFDRLADLVMLLEAAQPTYSYEEVQEYAFRGPVIDRDGNVVFASSRFEPLGHGLWCYNGLSLTGITVSGQIVFFSGVYGKELRKHWTIIVQILCAHRAAA